MLRLSLQLHKWIALVVGLQVLFWVAGGLVMTAIPIGIVRSEHHKAASPPVPLALDRVLSPRDVADRAGFGAVSKAVLTQGSRGPIWRLTSTAGHDGRFDALTGADVPQMSESEAAAAAARAYRGAGIPVRTQYLVKAPEEANAAAPVFRVDFDDWEHTAFYLDPFTGDVISRRSHVWRFYDFFWRLHVMDWKTGENFNNPLVIATTALTLPVVVTGFILLWIRLRKDLRLYRARAGSGRDGA